MNANEYRLTEKKNISTNHDLFNYLNVALLFGFCHLYY